MESGSEYVVKLNGYAQTKQLKPPEYKDLGSSGPPHLREFRQSVHFDGRDFPEGVGRSKKEAKHNAAKKACEILFNGNPDQSSTSNCVSPDDEAINFIGKISEYCQLNKCSSNYIEVSKEGPSHDLIFSYMLKVDNKEYPVARAKTVKEAKQKAAQLAWSELCLGTKGTADESFSEDQEPDPSLTTHTSQISEETNFISKVAGYCQQHKYTLYYMNVRQEGPSHAPLFYYKVVIDNKDYPEAQGKTIKEAKQKAAHSAWSFIRGDWSSLDSKSDSSAEFDTSEVSARRSESSDGSSWIQFEGSSNSVQSQPVSKPQDDAKEKNGASDQSATSTHSKIRTHDMTQFDSHERLGEGAFGCVYKARNKDLNLFSAIKEVETKNREKSLLEVKALKALNHPNIVRYFTFWFEDTRYGRSFIKPNSEVLFIEMELCDGGTLRRWIKEQNKETLGAARREQSLKIALQILNGVEYFHKKKLIHRDLKPENILFGQDGDVKIGDFGLVTTDNDEEIVERTEDRGTPNYMAPEQVGINYDRKVDIFALGLICFELFWRIATSHERLVMWPDVRCQRFPKEFIGTYAIESHIIKTMLSENPEARPEASALKIELEKWNKEAMDDQGNQTV